MRIQLWIVAESQIWTKVYYSDENQARMAAYKLNEKEKASGSGIGWNHKSVFVDIDFSGGLTDTRSG